MVKAGLRRGHLRDIIGTWGDELRGKRIALCVTASASCYRSPDIARRLMRYGAEVIPVMTKRASKLLSPEIMRWATGNDPIVEVTGEVEHVGLVSSSKVDAVLVAPASGNTIAKISTGISDNSVTLLASCALGSGIPLIISPAMHQPMMGNPLLTEALTRLREKGAYVIEPVVEEGKAKMAEADVIAEEVIYILSPKTLLGKRFIVTAGPTREYIDGVRFVSNASSGKMGVALARELRRLGGKVKLIHGPMSCDLPRGVESIRVVSSSDMLESVLEAVREGAEALFATAAVSDYRPSMRIDGKIDSRAFDRLALELKRTEKIVDEVRRIDEGLEIIAFKAVYGEIGDPKIHYEAMSKTLRPIILVINDVSRPDIGFESDYNEAAIITRSGRVLRTSIMSKPMLAKRIVDIYISEKRGELRPSP